MAKAREENKPLVLLEGKTDKAILETAWQKLNPNQECPYVLRAVDPQYGASGGGSGGVKTLAKAIETAHPDDDRQVVALFDRDEAGIKAYQKLSNFFKETALGGGLSVKKSGNKLAFALLLPVPKGREKYAEADNLSIELLFPDEALEQRTADGKGLHLQRPSPEIRVGRKKIATEEVPEIEVPPQYWKIAGDKLAFATQVVPQLEDKFFDAFHLLFENLLKVLTSHQGTDNRPE